MLDQENKQNRREKKHLSRCTRKQFKQNSEQTGLQEAPVSSMCGCFYLPFDEAGGGVGGCAAIRALEAALAFRQLPGQLRA